MNPKQREMTEYAAILRGEVTPRRLAEFDAWLREQAVDHRERWPGVTLEFVFGLYRHAYARYFLAQAMLEFAAERWTVTEREQYLDVVERVLLQSATDGV